MKTRATTLIGLSAWALCLVGCAPDQPVQQSHTSVTGTTSNATPSNAKTSTSNNAAHDDQDDRAAAQAFLDPATGEFRAPTEAELAQLKNRTQSASGVSSSSSSSITVTSLPNGMTQYDLGTRGHVEETACIQADGSLGACPQKHSDPTQGSKRSP